ncbi:MAG: AAA family ATPase [Nitrospiraceae bacterium]
MKIEFTGSGGSGKTTTAMAVAEALGLELLPSVARDVYEKRGIIEKDRPGLSQTDAHELQMEIFQTHLDQLENFKHHSYVADRSLVCRLAYSLLNDTLIESPDLLFLCEATKHAAMRVDLLVYFPTPHWEVKADNFRLNSLRETVALDALTLGFLQSAQIPAMTAFKGTVEDRTLQITSVARLTMAGKRKKPLVEVVRNPMKLG